MSQMQKDVFLSTEGDEWYKRNASKLSEDKPELHLFKKFVKPGNKVLEIGCASGDVSRFFSSLKASYVGIDPSSQAIHKAKETQSSGEFLVGTSDSLPFEDDSFDFVYFGFCLYLVDPKLLTRTVAEADRVLKNQGFLAYLDFDVKYPQSRGYAHSPHIQTRKMDFSNLFLGFPQFTLAHKSIFSHNSHLDTPFEENPQERTTVSVIYKNLQQGYFHEGK
jgi:ubiquinone/menaquinone biosynthesis C-methylase UbiE